MRRFEEPGAGRSRLPKLICSAGSNLAVAAPRRSTAMRLAGGLACFAFWLAAALAAWRERRRARRRLESWLTMDRRILVDIGLRPSDVQAIVYGDAAGAGLAERGGRWNPVRGDKVVDTRLRAPQLRVIASDDLDAAA